MQLPIIECWSKFCVNAHMNLLWLLTSNLNELHLDWKYLGKNVAFAKL